MNTPYPKPRWDLENDVLRLESMIILYEQEIADLTIENEKLEKEVIFLRRKLEYYKSIAKEEKS
tara:strand:+ start:134 stop:325 length:192 start_codon:yes stop_codon:yes gene_type:complete